MEPEKPVLTTGFVQAILDGSVFTSHYPKRPVVMVTRDADLTQADEAGTVVPGCKKCASSHGRMFFGVSVPLSSSLLFFALEMRVIDETSFVIIEFTSLTAKRRQMFTWTRPPSSPSEYYRLILS